MQVVLKLASSALAINQDDEYKIAVLLSLLIEKGFGKNVVEII